MLRWQDLKKWTAKQIRNKQQNVQSSGGSEKLTAQILMLEKFHGMVEHQSGAHCSDLDTFATDVMSHQTSGTIDGVPTSVIPTEEVVKLFMKLGFYNINKLIDPATFVKR